MAPARSSALESGGGSGAAPPGAANAARIRGPAADLRTGRIRRVLAWALCTAGLVAYNWWVLVPLKPGLMTSPDELFSNLEVSGQPYAAAMQHCDLLAGILIAGAFLAVGRHSVPGGLRDWLAMLAFAAAGAIGGVFPEVCADGISATCRRQEWHFRLPASQYVHIVAGIAEFAAITIALILSLRRTRAGRTIAGGIGTGASATGRTRTVGSYRWLWRAALVCYPLLGLAYLANRMGGVMEGVFFVGFTIMVITEMAERTRPASARSNSLPDQG
jgi:Protein of unknown function (DUF998)